MKIFKNGWKKEYKIHNFYIPICYNKKEICKNTGGVPWKNLRF